MAEKKGSKGQGDKGQGAANKDIVLQQQVVGRPPVPGAPHAPTDFQPAAGTEILKWLKASADEIRTAEGLASEISGSESYKEDFGNKAPDPDKLAEIVRLALLWDKELKAAERWLSFANDQRLRTWDAALHQIRELQIEFDHRISRDADLRDRYPRTGEFLGVRKVSAAHAAETRKANKKAKSAPQG